MALWSLFVEFGGKHFSTQVRASSAEDAVAKFLTGNSLSEFFPAKLSFTIEDIVLLEPMEGLINMYLCQVGRGGEYASIMLARTVDDVQPY